jgi:hypothetical protein
MPPRPFGRTVDAMSTTTTTTPLSLPERPWPDAEKAAPFLCTTAHTLRRLAREGRSPIIVRRIGGRWWFSRLDLIRFMDGVVEGEPA